MKLCWYKFYMLLCMDELKDMAIEVHIGKLIKQQMDEQGRRAVWLAKQLNCDRSNVYKIYRCKTIDATRLLKISQILQHDFFQYYSQQI